MDSSDDMPLSEMNIGDVPDSQMNAGDVPDLGPYQAEIETQMYPEYDQSEGSKVMWVVLLLYRTAHHTSTYHSDRVVCVYVFQIFIELNSDSDTVGQISYHAMITTHLNRRCSIIEADPDCISWRWRPICNDVRIDCPHYNLYRISALYRYTHNMP
jgi:hypothetical protein